MKMIIKDRGKGKTTGLIHTSEATGFRILTVTEAHAKYVERLSKEMGCVIPEPIPYYEYIMKKNAFNDKGILLDEVKCMLDGILDEYFGVHVYAGTMSDERIN